MKFGVPLTCEKLKCCNRSI